MREQQIVANAARLLTADDLSRLPDDGLRYELVEGHLIRMPPPKPRHGAVATNFAPLLQFVRANNLGKVFLSEVGFKLASNPDTVRAPDVAFIRRDRLPSGEWPNTYWPGAPDLAVEVVSPDDRLTALRNQAAEWLRHGASLVWVVDPARRIVIEFKTGKMPLTLTAGATLNGGNVVPGFSLPVRNLFD